MSTKIEITLDNEFALSAAEIPYLRTMLRDALYDYQRTRNFNPTKHAMAKHGTDDIQSIEIARLRYSASDKLEKALGGIKSLNVETIPNQAPPCEYPTLPGIAIHQIPPRMRICEVCKEQAPLHARHCLNGP